MKQEDKELLLKDLCARLPYKVKCHVPTEGKAMTLTGKRLNYFCFHDEKWDVDYSHEYEVVLDPLNDAHNGYIIKPYLRPMSSMTEEERKEYYTIEHACYKQTDWFNAHHFDYRRLIEKGLALEAKEEMYK